MNSPLISFIVKLSGGMLLTFGIHLAILHYTNHPLFENRIVLAYIVNYVLAILIYTSLYHFRKKYLDLLGFIFMAGSMLKFAVFFIFFYPFYKENGGLNSLEATSFLLPYLVSLLIEVIFLSNLLNKQP